ncbi:MAG: DUF4595 domain-containing protein [Muribaculaceae bacterium]|nr:DUF4595 domain-containing protein [Muribaculaceae bacterium]
MKYAKHSLLIAGTLMLGLCSCSDSDDDKDNNGTDRLPKPEQVFTEGIPSEVAGLNITTNADGLVSEIKEKDNGRVETTTTFEYGSFTPGRATEYQVKMTVIDHDDDESDIFYIALNPAGYASDVLEICSDGDEERWSFAYDTPGHLVRMFRSEGNNEVTVITYTGGDITSVKQYGDDDKEGWTAEISYGTTPIANKGGIMMYDETLHIDMDEFAPAFYAGLLGKATANLPVRSRYLDQKEDGEYESYEWELNADGLPVKLTVYEHEPWSEYPHTYDYTFVW